MHNCATLALYGFPNTPASQTNPNTFVFHDASFVLMLNGRVLSMCEIERVSRVKHDTNLADRLDEILEHALALTQERNSDLEIALVYTMGKHEIRSSSGRFVAKMDEPTSYARDGALAKVHMGVAKFDEKAFVLKVISHELAHVATGLPFYGTIPENSLLVHLDGAASLGNFSAFHFASGQLQVIEFGWQLSHLSKFFNANGLVFAILGATGNEHLSTPGKMMGLASYGTPTDELRQFLKDHDRFRNAWDEDARNQFVALAKEKFGWEPSTEGRAFHTQDRFLQNVLAALQAEFTETVLAKMKELKNKTDAEVLFYSGGCALNIATNAAIEASGIFSDIVIPPACSDCGLALGAASYLEFLRHGSVAVHGPYLLNYGLPTFNESAKVDPSIVAQAAEMLSQGKVIGICRGLAECGPRALGNRSLLGIPTVEMRDKLSVQMKRREWYRPVAPVMLEVNALKVTGRTTMPRIAGFMLCQFQILPEYQSFIQGAVHVDGTARIQVLFEEAQNPFVWHLLHVMHTRCGILALINTSFNCQGEPIVHTLDNAIASGKAMGIDGLVTNDELRVAPNF